MSRRSFYCIVGENIIKARRKARISQERLAYLSVIDRTYVGKIEKGRANPSLKVLCKISRTLKTPVCELTRVNGHPILR